MLNISRGLCKMAAKQQKKASTSKSGFPGQQLHSSWWLAYSFLSYVFWNPAYNMRQPRIISHFNQKPRNAASLQP